jgi:hypothetical protein
VACSKVLLGTTKYNHGRPFLRLSCLLDEFRTQNLSNKKYLICIFGLLYAVLPSELLTCPSSIC